MSSVFQLPNSLVGEDWKTLTVAIVIQVFSTIQGAILAQRHYNRYNHAHVPAYYLNCFAVHFRLQNCQSQIAQVEYQG